MNICVLGAGSIGGWVAAKLALAGNPVTALTSRGPLAEIEIREGGSTARAALQPLDHPPELLVIAVKAISLREAAERANPLIGEGTVIVPMLNGVPWWFIEGASLTSVDPDRRIAAALPFERLIGCVVHASCSRQGPSTILVKHADKLILGEPRGGSSERLGSLSTLFEAAGIRCEVSEDVRREIWYKLWGNATMNPLSAITRSTCDRILADAECRAWMLEGMAELAAIGAAIGCHISESGEDRMEVAGRLGPFRTSMLQDVEAGRTIELEALLGAPREIARERGMATPALDRLYGVTRLMAESLGLV